MYQELSLVSGYIHSLVERSPRGLCDDVVLRPWHFLLSISFTSHGCLEVIYSDVRLLLVVVQDEELLISKGKLDVLSLDARDRHCDLLELLSVHYIEDAETKGGSRREQVL